MALKLKSKNQKIINQSGSGASLFGKMKQDQTVPEWQGVIKAWRRFGMAQCEENITVKQMKAAWWHEQALPTIALSHLYLVMWQKQSWILKCTEIYCLIIFSQMQQGWFDDRWIMTQNTLWEQPWGFWKIRNCILVFYSGRVSPLISH